MAQPGMGVGASLASMGSQQMMQGMNLYGEAASEEAQREAKNTELQSMRRTGNMQLGSTLGAAAGWYEGAQIGSVGGPIGALVGAVAGGLLSRLF
jgi:hypothetical protein